MRPEDLALPLHTFAPPAGRSPVQVTWLGTAGFALEHAGFTVLIDPYVTRASLFDCVRGALRSDVTRVARMLPRADAIVAGHTHFDHCLDVPTVALQTGATVYGSPSCAHLCRAAGVPAGRVIDVSARTGASPFEAEVGPFALRFVPSVHSSLALGRVPFPGDIADCAELPMGVGGYRCGAVFSVDVRVAGRRIYHLGSADLVDAGPAPGVDLLLCCVAGWTTTPRFAPRVMAALRPSAVLLSHWDNFFCPPERGARALPGMQMPRLVEQLTALEPNLPIGTVPLLGGLSM